LASEGFKLFKGYYETIDGVSTPFIDKLIGLEDWRENCWNRRYPQHYGKKSLAYIKLLFGVNSSQIICLDDKPKIWTYTKQVIRVEPYKGGIHFNQSNNDDDSNNQYDNYNVDHDDNNNNNDDITNNNDSNEHNNYNHNKKNFQLYKIARGRRKRRRTRTRTRTRTRRKNTRHFRL